MWRAGTVRRPGRSGVPPELIAALVALAGLMLVLTLRKQGEVRLNFGLTCAVLLAMFGIGAVAGALFATRAAPQGSDGATAGSGILLAGTPARDRARRATAARDAGSIKIPIVASAPPARATRTRARSVSAPAGPVIPSSTEPASVRARPRGLTGRSHRSGGPRQSACATGGYAASRGHLRGEAGRLPVEHRPEQARPPPPTRASGRRSRSSPSSTSAAASAPATRHARGRRGAEAPMNALPDCGVGSALRRLRTSSARSRRSSARPSQALCENLGFDRAAVFSVRGRTLTLESVHGRDLNPQELDELTALASRSAAARPRAPRVGGAAPAAGGAGRGRPRRSARTRAPSGARPFVAAPVVCHQRPVALMHADLGATSQVLTEYDLETVWAFAEGFGYALERCVLAERLREQSARVVALARSTEASVVALSRPEIELDSPGRSPDGSAAPPAAGERARGRPHAPRARGALDARRG